MNGKNIIRKSMESYSFLNELGALFLKRREEKRREDER
jgi:hypothetical protein